MGHSIGSYTVLRKIASGGMGTVYVAVQRGPEGFSRTVALKQIHPHLELTDKWRKRFAEEARIGAELEHPNIVSVLDFDRDPDGDYIVMEYVSGCSLARLLKVREAPLTEPQAALVTREVLAGLEAAHGFVDRKGTPRPIIHRDVNPRNVLLSLRGEVKVTDFGIASIAGRSLTTVGALRGTVAYMAPEQARRHKVDERGDVFAAGLLLFELLSGRRAYQGRDETQMLELAKEGLVPLQLVDGCDAELRAAVAKAVEFSPSKRFQTAREFREALDGCLERLGRPRREELAELAVADAPPSAQLLDEARRDGERVTAVGAAPGDLATTEPPLERSADARASAEAAAATAERAADAPPAREGSRPQRWGVPLKLVLGLLLLGGVGGAALVWLLGGAKRSDDAASARGSSARDAAPALPRRAPRSGDAAARRLAAASAAADGAALPPEAGARSVGATASRPGDSGPKRRLASRPRRRRRARRRRYGKLVVNTLPVWSKVWIDGRLRGPTPLRLSLSAGRHRVRVRALGRGPSRSLAVRVRANKLTVKVIRVARPR